MATQETTDHIRGRLSLRSQLAELLLRWEEEYEQGKDISPDVLCANCPALAPALAERILSLKGQSWLRQADESSMSARSILSPESVHQDEKPRILAGRYRLDRVIGEGGSGQVWQGFDEKLRRPVAVKIPRPGQHSAAEQDERFMSEAWRVAQLRHDGIVAVHDVGRHEQNIFIVTDLVNGMELRRHLLSGPMPLLGALRIAAEAAEALHHAHQQGFVHRDVKPGNILVDGSGHVFVTDFGIAATAEEIRQQEGRRCGTLAYMSPEQHSATAPPLDHRTDIYSLGVVLYEMLTGKQPFQETTPSALRNSILQSNPRPPRSINPDIPVEAQRICVRCLEQSPDGRYATAKDMAEDLRRLLSRRNRSRFLVLLATAGITVTLALYNVYVLTRPTYTLRDFDRGFYDVMVDKGIDSLNRNDCETASAYFETALAMQKSGLVLCLKAEAHLKLHQYEQALACSDEALRIYPRFTKPYYIKGMVFRNTNRHRQALECFRRAVEYSAPNSVKEIKRLETDGELTGTRIGAE